MKRIVSLCLGLCVLLCGCTQQQETRFTGGEQTVETTAPLELCTQQQETLFTGGEQTVETTAPLELTGYALYEWYCANVDEALQREMDAYRGPFGGGIIGYPRQMRIIIGELSEDAPRLTLEQAEEIIQEVLSEPINYAEHYYVVKAALREIAEMDYDGGSGISHTYFCLNDAMTQYIDVSDYGVRYYDTQADICIEMCWFYEPEEFTSVAALIRQEKVPPVVPQSLEERCYSIATEEQKAELDAFQGPFELKDIAVYPRKTQEIVGLLPADAPRLTLEQAEAILQKMLDEGDASYDRACLAFREIAEVDYEGGSGLAFTHFCLNDAMTQSVVVHYSGVDYHDSQEGILIELVSFATEEFTSVLAMMEQGEIPPVRADSAE